jgi:hypothetical protein
MKYQLVLRFQGESVQEFDDLVVLEDLLVEELPMDSEIDGHDFGSGEFNIFILTDQPEQTFHAAEQTIQQYRPPQKLRAAYPRTGPKQLCNSLAPNAPGIHNRRIEVRQHRTLTNSGQLH